MTENNPHPQYRIADLLESERPRERLAAGGPAVLSDAELLAVLIRVGVMGENAVQVGQRLLVKFNGIGGLHAAPFDELCREHGIGEAKAATIQAAIELGHRLNSFKLDDRRQINSPEDVVDFVQYDMNGLEQEHLRIVLLDRRNRVIDITELYRGSVNSSQIRVGEIFKEAVRKNASAIVVVHNHPSGDPTPSPDDIAVTRAIIQAGKLLDVDVLDHLVIGRAGWVSLKKQGLAFS